MGILNIAFRDCLVWVSILVRKRLNLSPFLVVQFGRKGFRYLVEREQPINYIQCCHRMGILNIAFRDCLVWVSILIRKMLDLSPRLEIQFGRKWFGYLVEREQPINLYSVLLSYRNTKCCISRSFGLGFNPGT